MKISYEVNSIRKYILDKKMTLLTVALFPRKSMCMLHFIYRKRVRLTFLIKRCVHFFSFTE